MTQKVADRCRPSSEQNEDNVVLLLGPKKLYKNEHWEANFLRSDELIFFGPCKYAVILLVTIVICLCLGAACSVIGFGTKFLE